MIEGEEEKPKAQYGPATAFPFVSNLSKNLILHILIVSGADSKVFLRTTPIQ